MNSESGESACLQVARGTSADAGGGSGRRTRPCMQLSHEYSRQSASICDVDVDPAEEQRMHHGHADGCARGVRGTPSKGECQWSRGIPVDYGESRRACESGPKQRCHLHLEFGADMSMMRLLHQGRNKFLVAGEGGRSVKDCATSFSGSVCFVNIYIYVCIWYVCFCNRSLTFVH